MSLPNLIDIGPEQIAATVAAISPNAPLVDLEVLAEDTCLEYGLDDDDLDEVCRLLRERAERRRERAAVAAEAAYDRTIDDRLTEDLR